MSNLDKAYRSQISNIESRTGKTLGEFRTLIEHSGLQKHGAIRQMLMDQFGLGYGDANSLVHAALMSDGQREAEGRPMADVLAEIYTGAKSALRPIHDQLIEAIDELGDYEIAPKKGYISLRRKKQFAMIGPASKGRVEVGLNMKGLEGTDRLIAQPAGGMCQYKVFLTAETEVDRELVAWLRIAYDNAG